MSASTSSAKATGLEAAAEGTADAVKEGVKRAPVAWAVTAAVLGCAAILALFVYLTERGDRMSRIEFQAWADKFTEGERVWRDNYTREQAKWREDHVGGYHVVNSPGVVTIEALKSVEDRVMNKIGAVEAAVNGQGVLLGRLDERSAAQAKALSEALAERRGPAPPK